MIALISTLVWIFSLTVDHPKKITSISTHPSPHSSFRTPVPTKLYSVKTDYKTNNHSCLYIHMPIWKIISFESCSHTHATTKIGSLKKDYESNNHSCHQFFHVNVKNFIIWIIQFQRKNSHPQAPNYTLLSPWSCGNKKM